MPYPKISQSQFQLLEQLTTRKT